METIYGVLNFLLILDIVFILFFAVTARPNLKEFVLWTIIILLLPIVGFALCFNLGPVNYKGCFISERDVLGSDADAYFKEVSDAVESENRPGNETDYGLIKRFSGYYDATFSNDGSVETFEECKDYYDRMWKDIEDAREYIHIEVYILGNDDLSKRLMELLEKKIGEGVKVRFLCDYIGLASGTQYMISDFISKGGEFVTFNPIVRQTFSARKSNRLHKKAIIIDGRCSYTGGINFSDEYLGLSKLGKWKDLGLRLTGSVVHQMNIWFAIDWKYASGRDVPKENIGRKIVGGGDMRLQSISMGGYRKNDMSEVIFESLIRSAKRSIHIQTPYLVPTGRINRALIEAAESGVEVSIMTSLDTDFKAARYNNEFTISRLIKHGINVYGYSDAFLHTKRVIIDGERCLMGSANLDRLSLKYTFDNVVIAYSKDLSVRMDEVFAHDMKSCMTYSREGFRKRGPVRRVKGLFALFYRPMI